MADLRELYQEVILDHSKHPRNFGVLPEADHVAEGYNPLCGDKLHLYLRFEGGRVADVRFEGKGCAISTASASLMTEAVKGATREEAERLFERFHELVTGDGNPEEQAELGKLVVLAGVREFPVRIKCATLCWHTLRSALRQSGETVSTEGP